MSHEIKSSSVFSLLLILLRSKNSDMNSFKCVDFLHLVIFQDHGLTLLTVNTDNGLQSLGYGKLIKSK